MIWLKYIKYNDGRWTEGDDNDKDTRKDKDKDKDKDTRKDKDKDNDKDEMTKRPIFWKWYQIR